MNKKEMIKTSKEKFQKIHKDKRSHSQPKTKPPYEKTKNAPSIS
jgi:hypothetical protein